MSKHKSKHTADDLRGLSQLAVDATTGITDLVEAMHHNIASLPGISPTREDGRTSGITGFVYRAIRGTTQATGFGIDAALLLLTPYLSKLSSLPERENIQSVLNGVLGDHLLDSGNPMAIPMQIRKNGVALGASKESLSDAIPNATGKILLLVHGLCMNDRQWAMARADGSVHDHGESLQADSDYTAIYLHYNTGLNISSNGAQMAELLQELMMAWPVEVENITILAHSMGGLVTRSAYHHASNAGHSWTKLTKKIMFLGTPHQGAPLERGGHWFDIILGSMPYAAPFAKIAKVRSAGITDLRYANILDDEQAMVPLPENVACFSLAGTLGQKSAVLRDKIIGDGLVPLDSALGVHHNPHRSLKFPADHQFVFKETNHMRLLSDDKVYTVLKNIL